MLLSFAAAALLWRATSPRHGATVARRLLFALIVGDLIVRAWWINPVFDPAHLAEPVWLAQTKLDPQARFYLGGKQEGTLIPWDLDSSRAFLNPPGLVGAASRAALSGQTVYFRRPGTGEKYYPPTCRCSGRGFFTTPRISSSSPSEPLAICFSIEPACATAYFQIARRRVACRSCRFWIFLELFLYDWGSTVAPRVSVVDTARTVANPMEQIEALFKPGWDSRQMVLVERDLTPLGVSGSGVTAYARMVEDRPTRLAIEAGAGVQGGYLVLLDSYSDDWHVTVDGLPGPVARGNGLFRAVRIAPGAHRLEFAYRPRAFYRGAAISALATFLSMALLVVYRRRRPTVIRSRPKI